MYGKWRRLSVLGMAALTGCMMPMGTMLAAEENTVVVQEIEADSVSGNTVVSGDDAIPDDGVNIDSEVNADAGNAGGEINTDIENAGSEVDADNAAVDGIDFLSGAENEPASVDAKTQAGIAAPVIDIKWQGQSQKYDLGGKINYKYINNHDQAFECLANQDGQAVTLEYYLEQVSDTTAEAKGNEQMNSLSWQSAQSSSERISLSKDGSYILYVKAVGADGQTTYARSGGIVVDTISPAVTVLVEGKTYPEGTAFQVSEANLESVRINEKLVTPEADGSYRVSANGTSSSCVIRIKDKAGNEMTCSITVSGRDPAADGNVISKTGMYSLKTGVEYKLAEGKWKIYGDSTVYRGGSSFYAKTAGDYVFMKY
ncbi:MAG: hypothetical protein K2J99_01750 [Lachnospiraceae bacterium]|nr:hypothetical protein [Lachnospiraceae bacterium]